MATLDTKAATGTKKGSVELDDAMFGVEPNVPVMHQVVTAQLAARRSGTQSVKTRAEVRGGGAKPWKQKGTGRARAGSSRAPHWVGGGASHAPKPRSYAQRTPKKMIRLALKSALSDRYASERILVIDWDLEAPSTKAAAGHPPGQRRLRPDPRRPALRGHRRVEEPPQPRQRAHLRRRRAQRLRRAGLRLAHLHPGHPARRQARRRGTPSPSRHRQPRRFRVKDPRDIILAPVVSEKSYALLETGVYTFKVHPDASSPRSTTPSSPSST